MEYLTLHYDSSGVDLSFTNFPMSMIDFAGTFMYPNKAMYIDIFYNKFHIVFYRSKHCIVKSSDIGLFIGQVNIMYGNRFSKMLVNRSKDTIETIDTHWWFFYPKNFRNLWMRYLNA